MLQKNTPLAVRAVSTDYTPEEALASLGAEDAFVIGQLGQSLDGRIATPTGASKYINGTDA